MSLTLDNNNTLGAGRIQQKAMSVAISMQESCMRYALECQRAFELESQQLSIREATLALWHDLESAAAQAGIDATAIKTTPEEANFVINYINERYNCNVKDLRVAVRKMFQRAGYSEKGAKFFVKYIEETVLKTDGINPFEY